MSTQITRLSLRELESKPEKFRADLFSGLQDCGFIILRDHQIDKNRLAQAYSLTEALFALPLDNKMHYDSGIGAARGYTAFGRENAVGNPHADLKEFWHIGQDVASDSPYSGVYPDNVWPKEIEEFEACFRALYRDLESLGKTLLIALGKQMGLPDAFFPDMVRDGNSVLRLLHYPKLDAVHTGSAMRAAPHADINLITLLVGATDSGLELRDGNGQWIPVESDPDEIVIDTGDMMSRLTNDLLPSTVHRVCNPRHADRSRYSMPFFLHPHSHARLDCLPQCSTQSGANYVPISAGEFLAQRLRDIGLMKPQDVAARD